MPDTIKEKISDPEQQALFETLYEAHNDAMKACAGRILRCFPHLTEDVLQEVWIRMFSHLDQLSDMTLPAARIYLLISVKNTALLMISKEPFSKSNVISLQELAEDAVPARTDLLDEICATEASRQLTQAILSLPEDTQDVMYLYFVESMNLRKISAHLHLSYSTVSKRFRRGKQQLKKKIQKIGGVLVYEIK